MALMALMLGLAGGWFLRQSKLVNTGLDFSVINDQQIVTPSQSIMEALSRARPGSEVIVEPGEYREHIVLKDQVRLVSRVPRAAVLRLPTSAAEDEVAVLAAGLSRAEMSGFRIVGDAATPLGIGILVQNAAVSIVDVEVSGASAAATDFSGEANASLVASDLHDNPGAGLVVRSGASPRIVHSSFARNGLSDRAGRPMVVEPGAHPTLSRNLFHGISVEQLGALDEEARHVLSHDNHFADPPAPPTATATPRPSSRGRR